MTPDMDALTYDDVVRVGTVLEHLILAIRTVEVDAGQCGREELVKAMFAMRGVMEGFRDDVAGIIGEWDRERLHRGRPRRRHRRVADHPPDRRRPGAGVHVARRQDAPLRGQVGDRRAGRGQGRARAEGVQVEAEGMNGTI